MNGVEKDKAAIEIHDSTLEAVKSCDEDLVAVVHAYVHRSGGRAGFDGAWGCWQLTELRFKRGTVSGMGETSSIELLGGRLVLSGETHENAIPLPLEFLGASRLELESWNDVRVILEGEGVIASVVGPPENVEEYGP